VSEAKDVIRQQAVVHMDETGSPIGNADGNNPEGRRGWLWVLVTPLLSVFEDSLSRSAEVAKQLLGTDFSGILISDRYGAYSHPLTN